MATNSPSGARNTSNQMIRENNKSPCEPVTEKMNMQQQQEISIQLKSTQLMPVKSARNLSVTTDDQLTFKVHVASIAQSRQFVLYKIRKIRPYLSEQAAQLLLQALIISSTDYCKSLLAGLITCTIKALNFCGVLMTTSNLH